MRLTARNKQGLAYLVNVKLDEQEVTSPHKNTLQCLFDSMQRLAEYEDTGLSPKEVCQLINAAREVRDWLRVALPDSLLAERFRTTLADLGVE